MLLTYNTHILPPEWSTNVHVYYMHSARGFKVAEKYCDTTELQVAAVAAVAAASQKRWNHMNGLYWYTLYGRTDDTPAEEV